MDEQDMMARHFMQMGKDEAQRDGYAGIAEQLTRLADASIAQAQQLRRIADALESLTRILGNKAE
jgi:hypothetical protein